MIRATRIELIMPKERKAAWVELSKYCQQMTNRMWQLWLCHHVSTDSADSMRAYLDQYATWRDWKGTKKKRPNKPKPPVQCIDKELSNRIYHDISDRFEQVNARTRVLLQNKWQKTVTTRKAARGKLSGWLSILFCHESVPSFTRPVPLPFDKANAKINAESGRYVLTLRVERIAGSDKQTKPSVVDECVMMLGKRKARSVKTIVDRILSGEYTFKGSSLSYDRGKWFALVSYENPKRDTVSLDGNKILHVFPAHRQPWMVKIDGQDRPFYLGGSGKHVTYFRQALTRSRYERQEHYRWAGSAQKGRGRERAISAWTKLSSRWKHFVKRYNHEVTRRVVNIAIERKCGSIVYHQPMDSRRDRCFLSGTGNLGARTAWDYFQFGTMLASKCEQYGIEYETKKRTAKAADEAVSAV